VRAAVAGKDIALTTTNGTKAFRYACKAFRILAGAFVNLNAVARYCINAKRNVVVLCAGWQDKINMEDTLFGGALIALLAANGYNPAGDAARIALSLWMDARHNLHDYLAHTEHVQRLLSNGLKNDMDYCLMIDRSSLAPFYDPQTDSIVAN
jgi:2-phosphosulfolactate phosphatase